MSIFLMGCFDPASRKWCTVTKVHGGHDDQTLERLQVSHAARHAAQLSNDKFPANLSQILKFVHFPAHFIQIFQYFS